MSRKKDPKKTYHPNWGGPRTPGPGKRIGKKPKPPEQLTQMIQFRLFQGERDLLADWANKLLTSKTEILRQAINQLARDREEAKRLSDIFHPRPPGKTYVTNFKLFRNERSLLDKLSTDLILNRTEVVRLALRELAKKKSHQTISPKS